MASDVPADLNVLQNGLVLEELMNHLESKGILGRNDLRIIYSKASDRAGKLPDNGSADFEASRAELVARLLSLSQAF